MRYSLFILIFLSLSMVSFSVLSQNQFSTSSQRAIKKYRTAMHEYHQGNNNKAISLLERAIRIDSEFIDAYLGIADIYHAMGELQSEIDYYKRAIEIDSSFYPRAFYYLGKAEYQLMQYDKAQEHLSLFLSYNGLKNSYRIGATFYYKSAVFADSAVQNPVAYNPQRLGNGINSQYDEYYPSITADENTLIFTRLLEFERVIRGKRREFKQEDFFVSQKRNDKWGKAQNMSKPINTMMNEGAQTITTDGHAMYFTACNRPDGKGKCDIYYTEKQGNSWQRPKNLGEPINTPAWESQPSISPDGKTLFFISNRPGGIGQLDIWKSERKKDGSWSEPVNLGKPVNTPRKEKSPFIHFDNETLYFASNGHHGIGKLDVYVTEKSDSGAWAEPTNLGYPINTNKKEESMIVNPRGNTVYFSTNRGDTAGTDIYTFSLYKDVRPTPVSYVRGTVYRLATKEKLKAACTLIDVATGDTVMKSESRLPGGNFLMSLPHNRNYVLQVSKKGYLFYSKSFYLEEHTYTEPYQIDVPLKKIKPGAFITLSNIHFEFDSYKLRPESKPALMQLISFMKRHPYVKAKISGHTDSIGTKESNLKLSKQRSQAVADFLIKHQINKKRLITEGYGESQPVAPNSTSEGRAKNRRTEFTIIENNAGKKE